MSFFNAVMGCAAASWQSLLYVGYTKVPIFIGGIDDAGKTSILHRWKTGEPYRDYFCLPTLEYRSETITWQALRIQITEIRAHERVRPCFLSAYLKDKDGVVYVVNSTDSRRIDEIRKDFITFLSFLKNADTPVLIFFNKQDCSEALTLEELTSLLGLQDLSDGAVGVLLSQHVWKTFPCSAATGEGLNEGLDWLSSQMLARSLLLSDAQA